MEMKETKLHPCYCGGEMQIKKVSQHCGMDGTYWNWELTCNKCGLTKTYAADDFYGRDYKTFEEVVEDWNKKKEEMIKAPGQELCEDYVSRKAVLEQAYFWSRDEFLTVANPLYYLQKRINSLPPVTPQQSCEDIAKAFQLGLAFGFGEKHDEMDKIIEEVKKAVTPKPKMGRWAILKDEYGDVVEAVCSCCDKNGNHEWAFCPNCGAKMVELRESEG